MLRQFSTSVIFFFFLFTAIQLSGQENIYSQILNSEFTEDGTGASAIVTKGNKVIFIGAAGQANVELDVKMKPEHVFRLGSITKQFTAVSILKLMEEGKIDLQAEITQYLPDYPTNGKTITIEHLLNHTSGIQSYTDMDGFMQDRTREDMTPMELIEVFKNEPMNFDPGDEHRYNNSGYILLGAIIEKVSGQSYAEYVSKNIFKPLGMNSTYYGGHQKIIPNRAAGYMQDANGLINAHYLSMTLPYAAGSLVGTVSDLHKWNRAIFDGKVISKKSLKMAHTPSTLNNGETVDYGYGWAFGSVMGEKTIEHGGGIFGFLTQAMYLPDHDVYVAVFSNCNCKSPNMVAGRLAAAAIGKPVEFNSINLPVSQLEEFSGVYQIENSDHKRAVFVQDGMLMTQRNQGRTFAVTPYEKDAFYYSDTRSQLIFKRDDSGKIIGQELISFNGDVSFAERTNEKVDAVELINVPVETLGKYVGSYELAPNFVLSMRIENGKLMGQATGQGTIPMDATSENEFVNQQVGVRLVFEKADGPSSYLTLFQGGQEIRAKRVEK